MGQVGLQWHKLHKTTIILKLFTTEMHFWFGPLNRVDKLLQSFKFEVHRTSGSQVKQ